MSAWKMYYVFVFTYIVVCLGNPTPCGSYLPVGRGTFAPTDDVILEQSAVLHCTWNLFTTDDSKVLVQFIRFQLPSKDCSVDNVTIFDLDINRKVGVFCGTEKQPSILSTRSQMRVTLNTISPLYSAPFVASYEPYQCGGLLTSSNGTFSSPLYPNSYPLNSDCQWTIVAPTPGLQLTFPFFDVGLPSCTFEKVAIYEGADESAPLLDVLCGSLKGRAYRTAGSSLHIVFRANQWTQRAIGFEAIYKAIESTDHETDQNIGDQAMHTTDDNKSSPENLEVRGIDETHAKTDISSGPPESNTDVPGYMNFENTQTDTEEHEPPSSTDNLELIDQSGITETPVSMSPSTITTPIPAFSTGSESAESNNTKEHAIQLEKDNEKTIVDANISSSAMNSDSNLNENRHENQNDIDRPEEFVQHKSMVLEDNRLTQPVIKGNDDENEHDTWKAGLATYEMTDEIVGSTEPTHTKKSQSKVEGLTASDVTPVQMHVLDNENEMATNQTKNDQTGERGDWTMQTPVPATNIINPTPDDGQSDTISSDPFSTNDNEEEEEEKEEEERKRSSASDTKPDERVTDDQVAVTNVHHATEEQATSMIDSSMHESTSPENEVDQQHGFTPVFEPVSTEEYNLTSEGNFPTEESLFEPEEAKDAPLLNAKNSSVFETIPSENWNLENSDQEEKSEEVVQNETIDQAVQINEDIDKKENDISFNGKQVDPSASSSFQDEFDFNNTSTQGIRDEPTVVTETPEQFVSDSSQTGQEEVITPTPFQGPKLNESEVTSSWTGDTYRANQTDSEHRTNINAGKDVSQPENENWDIKNGLTINSERQPLLEEDPTKEISKKEQKSSEQVQDSSAFEQTVTQDISDGTVIADLSSNSEQGLPNNPYLPLINSNDVNTEATDRDVWDATAAGPPIISELKSNGHTDSENAEQLGEQLSTSQNGMSIDSTPIKQLDAETVLNSQTNGDPGNNEATDGVANSIEKNASDDERLTTPVTPAGVSTAQAVHAENSEAATDQIDDHNEQIALASGSVQVTTLDPPTDVLSMSTENTTSDEQVKETEPTSASLNATLGENDSESRLETNISQELMDNSTNLYRNGNGSGQTFRNQHEATDYWLEPTEPNQSEEIGTKPKSVWDQSETLTSESVSLQPDNSNRNDKTDTSVDTGSVSNANWVPNESVHANGTEQAWNSSSQQSLMNEQWTSDYNRPVKKLDPSETLDDYHSQSDNPEKNVQSLSSDYSEILHDEYTRDTTSSASKENQDRNTTVIQIEPKADNVTQDSHSVGPASEHEAMTTAATTVGFTPQQPLISDTEVETQVNTITDINENEKNDRDVNGNADEVRNTASESVESSEMPSKSNEQWTTDGSQMEAKLTQLEILANGDPNDKTTEGVNYEGVQHGLNLMGASTIGQSTPNPDLAAFTDEKANTTQTELISEKLQEESSLMEPQGKVKQTITSAYGTVTDESAHSVEFNETSSNSSTQLETAGNRAHSEDEKKITNVDRNTIKVTQSSLDNPSILDSAWLPIESGLTAEPVRFQGLTNEYADGNLPQSTNHESNTDEPVTDGEHNTNKEISPVSTGNTSDQLDRTVSVVHDPMPENIPVESSTELKRITTQASQFDSYQPTSMVGNNEHGANMNTTASTIDREKGNGNSEQSWTSPTMSNTQSNGYWTSADNEPEDRSAQSEKADNGYATGDSAELLNQKNPDGTSSDQTKGDHDGNLKVSTNPDNDILTDVSTSVNGYTVGSIGEDSTGETNPVGSLMTSDTETTAPEPIPNVMDMAVTTANDANKNTPEYWNQNNNNPDSELPPADLDRILNARSEQRMTENLNEVSNPAPAEEQSVSHPDQQSINPLIPIDRDKTENTPVSSNKVDMMEDVGTADSKTGTDGIEHIKSNQNAPTDQTQRTDPEISQSVNNFGSVHLVAESNEIEDDRKNSGYSYSRPSVVPASITLSILLLQFMAV